MDGHNPAESLLPLGSGTIMHMSGGEVPLGFNHNVSLIADGPGTITTYTGGADQEVTPEEFDISFLRTI